VLNKRVDGKQNKRAVAEKLVEMAKNGNTEAIKVIFDRVDGKVPQEHTGEGGGPLSIRVVYGDDSA
jgi:hypothetical protein